MTGIKLAPVSGYLCGWLPRWALAVGLLLALAGCGNLETAAHESDFFRNRLGTDGVRHSGPFSISPVVTAKYLRLFRRSSDLPSIICPIPTKMPTPGRS